MFKAFSSSSLNSSGPLPPCHSKRKKGEIHLFHTGASETDYGPQGRLRSVVWRGQKAGTGGNMSLEGGVTPWYPPGLSILCLKGRGIQIKRIDRHIDT
jgi:hypothetical protein